MTEAIARVTEMGRMLERYQGEFLKALPRAIDPQRFARIALTTWRNDGKLAECDPLSFAGAVLECAQLGLVPDMSLGQVYFVPFWNSKRGVREVQMMIGYKGFVVLILRSGEVTDVNAQVVHDGDTFEFEFGSKPFLRHSWNPRKERGEAVAVWFMANRANGDPHFQIMTSEDIAKVKRQVFAKNRWKAEEREGKTVAVATSTRGEYVVDTPWTNDSEMEMWRKTAVRRGAKLLNLVSDPLSAFQRAASLDERADIGESQDLMANLPDAAPVKLATVASAAPPAQEDFGTRDRMERMKAEAKAQLEAAKQAIPTTLTPEQLSELAAAKAKMETAKSSADTAPASTGATGKAEAPPPAQGQAPPVAANSAPPDEPESGFGTEDAKRADLIRKICCASATPWTTTQVDKVLGAPAMRAPIEVLELLLVERSKNPDEKPTKKRGKKNGEEQTWEPEQAEMFGGGYNSDADDGAR